MEYPKIETLFTRDEKTFKVIPTQVRNACYGLIKTWQWTEKIDGTNTRIIWDGINKKLSFGGRTDNAQMQGRLLQVLQESVTAEQMEALFGADRVTIYGEGYGGKIQKGSYYSKEQAFIVFDVLVETEVAKWWLDWTAVNDIAGKLKLKTVPFIGELSLEQAVELVSKGIDSLLAKEQTGELVRAEGIVGRTVETIYDKHLNRMIVKLKTRDF